MLPWIPFLIAFACIIACLFLWFRNARRVMLQCSKTVNCAAEQVAQWRKKGSQAGWNLDSLAVLERSEYIYQQAVNIYNQTMRKPWIYPLARLMGFHSIPSK